MRSDLSEKCLPFGNGVVTFGGHIIRIATSKGVVGFEWHSYFGPMPVKLAKGIVGDERRLPDKHPFWEAVTRWAQSGMHTEQGKGGLWAVVPTRKEMEG